MALQTDFNVSCEIITVIVNHVLVVVIPSICFLPSSTLLPSLHSEEMNRVVALIQHYTNACIYVAPLPPREEDKVGGILWRTELLTPLLS